MQGQTFLIESNVIQGVSRMTPSIIDDGNKAEPLEATLIHAPIYKDSLVCHDGKRKESE